MRASAFFVILAIAPGESTTRTAASVADCRHLPAAPSGRASANDNRSPAGTVRDGVRTVRLVAHTVAWQPDGANGCALTVNAFSEDGRPTQIPGPLIRVRAGTEVRVSVRNALAKTLWVRGLQDRAPGTLDSTEVLAGATHEFRFIANTTGARYYWAGRVDAVAPVSDADGQLVGALVVDPREAGSKPASDRIIVLTRWTPEGTAENRGFQVNAFNGRSWPNTERFTYTAGDSVFWHVINGSDTVHEMHLHGFYFRIDATGFAVDPPRPLALSVLGIMRVTSQLRANEWMSIAWSPERPGNWLFHCHLLTHMSGAQRLDRMPGASTATVEHDHAPNAKANHALDDMGGLVLGLEVRPSRSTLVAKNGSPSPAPLRSIDIFANTRPRTFGEAPGFGFVAQEGSAPPARDSIRIPGSPLILTRGEPIQITVHNRLATPLSVHWHGIELDSYFDGVGGFSGAGSRIAPMIAAEDSFVVRFTPPRAGTFMYHTHGESGDELASGLYGPLIVLEPGATFDANTDRVFMLADGGPGDGKPVFVNGTSAPDTMQMVVGSAYRLRFISIPSNQTFVARMSGPGEPLSWRVLATDGYETSSTQSTPVLAGYIAGPGRTRDYAFTPATPGDYVLSVIGRSLTKNGGVTTGPATTVPIHIHAAAAPSRGLP